MAFILDSPDIWVLHSYLNEENILTVESREVFCRSKWYVGIVMFIIDLIDKKHCHWPIIFYQPRMYNCILVYKMFDLYGSGGHFEKGWEKRLLQQMDDWSAPFMVAELIHWLSDTFGCLRWTICERRLWDAPAALINNGMTDRLLSWWENLFFAKFSNW